MNQIDQKQLLRRQEETISWQSVTLLQDAREIENLQDMLDETVKKAGQAVREISFASDACMFTCGALTVCGIVNASGGAIVRAALYIASAFLTALCSRAFRRSDWI